VGVLERGDDLDGGTGAEPVRFCRLEHEPYPGLLVRGDLGDEDVRASVLMSALLLSWLPLLAASAEVGAQRLGDQRRQRHFRLHGAVLDLLDVARGAAFRQ
jgi:hypothetical protein